MAEEPQTMRTGSGFGRVAKATRYSLRGLKSAWLTESAIRQEVTVGVLLIPMAMWIAVDLTQFLMLMTTVFIVIIIELINTAIEAVVDRVGHDFHELSGRAKDLGSAAVFIGLVLLCIVWGGVIIQNFIL